ncbi:MAG: hypothetical protein ACJAYU_002258 [Bradymonadia bacterium]
MPDFQSDELIRFHLLPMAGSRLNLVDGMPSLQEPDSSDRPSLREPALAVGLMLAFTVVLDLVGFAVPFVRANQVALFAFVFLWLPQRILPREKDPADYGLTTKRLLPGLAEGTAWALLLFVAFVPCFHVWNTYVLGQSFHFEPGAYFKPPDKYFGEPLALADGEVAFFHQYDRIGVEWHPESGPWAVEIISDAELLTTAHAPIETTSGLQCETFGVEGELPITTCVSRGSSPRVFRARFRSLGGTFVEIRASEHGDPVSLEDYRVGFARDDAGSVTEDQAARFPLHMGWLPLSLVLQVLLIALPEEFFYRGYLQRRLDESRGRAGFKLGPLFITKNNLIVSAIFATGHFVIGLAPARLAVFFPSLLFGILRDRTDGIAAPVAFHAGCNLMVQIVAVHYWA